MKIIVPFLMILMTIRLLAEGGLVWEDTHLELPAEPGQEEIVAVFRFENTGEEAVEIGKIRSSCGCTVPVLEKRVYAPGESGEIRAIFTVGDRVGRQRKDLRVQVLGKGDEFVVLSFATNIPQIGRIHPKLLLWREGKVEGEKLLRIELDEESSWKLLELPEDFPFTVRELESDSPKLLTLGVSPKTSLAVSKHQLTFEFSTENSTERKRVYLLVR